MTEGLSVKKKNKGKQVYERLKKITNKNQKNS
jgi:hypothetical protein